MSGWDLGVRPAGAPDAPRPDRPWHREHAGPDAFAPYSGPARPNAAPRDDWARKPSNGDEDDIVLDSIRSRIAALDLDLTDLTIVTEAATGAYAVTAVIAAMAGAARIHAIGRDTARHGSFRDAVTATLGLAERAGVADRISVGRAVTPEMLASCDILTNCGHLRPISRQMIGHLPERAVIALMYEGWEFREGDIDLAACAQRGIRVAAVNERHPAVGVFAFLGPLCARLLVHAGHPLPGKQIALACDNPFAPFLQAGLRQAGATVTLVDRIGAIPAGRWDVVVLAVDPGRNPPLGRSDFARLTHVAPGAVLAQFWGDVDRAAALRANVHVFPPVEPAPGHMGILLSDLGYEPIIRLQGGGIKAAEDIFRGKDPVEGDVAELLERPGPSRRNRDPSDSDGDPTR